MSVIQLVPVVVRISFLPAQNQMEDRQTQVGGGSNRDPEDRACGMPKSSLVKPECSLPPQTMYFSLLSLDPSMTLMNRQAATHAGSSRFSLHHHQSGDVQQRQETEIRNLQFQGLRSRGGGTEPKNPWIRKKYKIPHPRLLLENTKKLPKKYKKGQKLPFLNFFGNFFVFLGGNLGWGILYFFRILSYFRDSGGFWALYHPRGIVIQGAVSTGFFEISPVDFFLFLQVFCVV